jgi:hypothetical protein
MRASRPHLEKDASVAGNRVHLLNLWKVLQAHHALGLAPPFGIHVDEGEEWLADRRSVQGHLNTFHYPGVSKPFDPLMHGGRRQSDGLAYFRIGSPRILYEYA